MVPRIHPPPQMPAEPRLAPALIAARALPGPVAGGIDEYQPAENACGHATDSSEDDQQRAPHNAIIEAAVVAPRPHPQSVRAERAFARPVQQPIGRSANIVDSDCRRACGVCAELLSWIPA